MPVQCTRKNVKILGCRNVLTAPYHKRKNHHEPILLRQPARSGKHPNARWRAERLARLRARVFWAFSLVMGGKWKLPRWARVLSKFKRVDVNAMQRLKLLCRCDDIERIEM